MSGLLNIDGLNVVTVYATDLEKTANFYVDILGFTKKKDVKPGILLDHLGAGITIYIEGGRQARTRSDAVTGALTAICLNSAEGVKKALEKLERAGVPIIAKYGELGGAFAGIQFIDPSGNLIEIAGEP